jgi:Zn-dependent peptidase ImmA (M78 family)
MPGPVSDPRAGALLTEYRTRFGGADLPVPVESIAEDLLSLIVDEEDLGDCSGLLYPADRRIILNATESATRKRFTLAHELGHWVCQVREGVEAPVFCRAADIAPDADRSLEREANVFAAELLMPEEAVRACVGEGELASRFAVSAQAMAWRLFSFGLGESPST